MQQNQDIQFAREMVETYMDLLRKNAGATQVTIDGNVVSYEDLEATWTRWKNRLDALTGKSPAVARIRMRSHP